MSVTLFRRMDGSVMITVGTGSGITLRTLHGVGGFFVRTGATPKTGSRLASSTTLGVLTGLTGRNGSATTLCMRRKHRSLTRRRLTRIRIVGHCLPGRLSTRRLRATIGTVVTRINTANPGSVNGIVNATAGRLTKGTSKGTVDTLMGRLLTWGC